jgi:hypothetical protein
MPRDTAGNYNLPAGNPVASGEIISASWANSTMGDLGQTLSASLDRYGRGGMLAPFQFTDGTEAAPGATWSNEPTTGFYRAAYGDLRLTLTNADVQRWTNGNSYLWRNNQWEEILTSSGGSGGTTINNLVVTGSFTSPGIDDNATSTQITVTDTDVDFSGNIDVTGTATLPDANVTTLDVTGVSTIVDADVTTLDVTGTATLADADVTTLDVTGTSTLADADVVTLDVTGTATLADANVTTLDVTGVSTLATVTADSAVAGTETTSISGSTTLDFSAQQNFVLTLTGNVTLADPTTETVGQSGFIVFIQDGTGGRTVSLGTEYETAGAGGLTLSTAASTTDIVPYVVAASGRILLGAPQLAFG